MNDSDSLFWSLKSAAITAKPRMPEREPISVRQFGETAIGVGTQVAVRREGRWRFAAMQLTRKS